jgi:hypothetical protein
MHEGFPLAGLGMAYEQALHGSAARHTPAEQPCWKDTGVVDDEHASRLEKLRKRGNGSMAHRAGCTIQEKHARGAALRGGLLRNQFRRKIEIEIADVHVRNRV